LWTSQTAIGSWWHCTALWASPRPLEARLKDIAPSLVLDARQEFVRLNCAPSLLAQGARGQDGLVAGYDFVIDAIDSMLPKLELIEASARAGVPIITSMGAGGRMDAAQVRVVPLSSTFNDPFAAHVRKKLRQRGVALEQISCVWSTEPVSDASLVRIEHKQSSAFKRSYHGTIAWLPSMFGMLAASHVVNYLVKGPGWVSYQAQSSDGWMVAVEAERAKRRSKSAGSTAVS